MLGIWRVIACIDRASGSISAGRKIVGTMIDQGQTGFEAAHQEFENAWECMIRAYEALPPIVAAKDLTDPTGDSDLFVPKGSPVTLVSDEGDYFIGCYKDRYFPVSVDELEVKSCGKDTE